MAKLIEIYKYNSVRAASIVLASMLNETIAGEYILVPLPTIRKHIRERGFDHVALMCRKTGRPIKEALMRVNNSTQVGASSEQRRLQAQGAYVAIGCEQNKKYLLVDDVWTTGSSMIAACTAMRKAGAKNLAIAVIARSK